MSALLLEKLEQLEAFGHHQKADPQYYPRPLGPACHEVPKMVCFNPRILLLLLATSPLSNVQTSAQRVSLGQANPGLTTLKWLHSLVSQQVWFRL